MYVLPKHLDVKVARLHLKKLGVKLTRPPVAVETSCPWRGVRKSIGARPSTRPRAPGETMPSLGQAGLLGRGAPEHDCHATRMSDARPH